MKNHRMKTRAARILTGLLVLAAAILIGSLLAGCQAVTRHWGGKTRIELPENTKVLECTWKDDSIWVLMRPMRDGEEPEEVRFQEYCDFGFAGEVVFIESKEK